MHTDPGIHYTQAHRLGMNTQGNVLTFPCIIAYLNLQMWNPHTKGEQCHFIFGTWFLDFVIHGSPTINPHMARDNWVPGISALYLNWLILSRKTSEVFTRLLPHHFEKERYCYSVYRRRNRFLGSEMIAQVHIASQWSHLAWKPHPSSWSPALATLSWIHLEKRPVFESPEVVFSLWSLPLWPAALVADCLLSTETCGQHKGPIAIALKCLPFRLTGQLLSVASRLGEEGH